jgi:iron(III) transport system permease protein
MRPFNFETFATQAYIYASQDLLEAAAAPFFISYSYCKFLYFNYI